MTLKQSDDPKFPLYGELPSPSTARSDGGFSSGGAALPPAFLAHPATPFLPPAAALYGSPGGGHSVYPLLPPAMGGGAAPQLAADGYAGGSSLTLLLSEEQAALLLGDGSRAVLEVEQVGAGPDCAAHTGGGGGGAFRVWPARCIPCAQQL